ncbi:MAG: RluA family pseudouridine synthase [Pseudomonadota bacterium]
MSGAASNKVRQFTVGDDDDGVRLDRWFKRNLPQIGFATISRWARTGQIRVDGKRTKPEDRLAAGQVLRVPPGGDSPGGKKPRERRELSGEDIAEARAMVIRETATAIVLNKPPGLATQGGSKTNRHVDGLLDAFVEDDETPRPRLVHRLDKDTSGVLLIARTPGSAAAYSKRFAGRTARKVYWALVVGVPEVREGTIDAPLAKQPGTGGEKMHVDEEAGQPAKTRYRVVERAGNSAAWVELEPLTGRTHQLRVHMAAIGHPIVGDGKYGGQDAFLTGSVSRKMHLHARRLIISEPGRKTTGAKTGGGKLDVTADLPEHFAASMEQLGFDLSLSDASPMRDEAPERTPAEKKQAARQHAKQYRKDRRGERKSRTKGTRGGPSAKGGKPGGGKPRKPSSKGKR